MSYCTQQILLLAGNIYTGIGSPTSQSIGFVSGWITQSGNLGDINNRLTTCFYLSGDGPCIAGGFGAAESSIYTLLYQTEYYRGRANAVLANGDGVPWTSISEGDTKVAREGTAQRAKVYLELATVTEKSLFTAIANWKLGHTFPTTVDGSDLYSWPTP